MATTRRKPIENNTIFDKPARTQVSSEIREFIISLLPELKNYYRIDMWPTYIVGNRTSVRVNVWSETKQLELVYSGYFISYSEFFVIEKVHDGYCLVRRGI